MLLGTVKCLCAKRLLGWEQPKKLIAFLPGGQGSGILTNKFGERHSGYLCFKLFKLTSESCCLWSLPCILHIWPLVGVGRAYSCIIPWEHRVNSIKQSVSWLVRITTVYKMESFPAEVVVCDRAGSVTL